MKWVGVLPFVYAPYLKECRKTMHPDFVHNVLFVDNTVNNIGIMASHNRGVDFMKEREADWLVIISAAVRFGEPGGMDFVEQLERNHGHHVLHGVSKTPDNEGRVVPYGWHLTAFNRRTIEAVGKWDENFSPYGLDDIDMSLRIQKHFGDKLKWDKVHCDASDTTHSHSIQIANVKSAYPPRDEYFYRKWGRRGGEWDNPSFDRPFNDSAKPLSYWPKPDDPRSIHQVEFKGEWGYAD